MRCVRGDDPEFASYLRIEKRALAGDGRRVGEAELAHGIVEESGCSRLLAWTGFRDRHTLWRR